jgi:hypothetical protein
MPRKVPACVEIEPQWRGYEYFVVGDQIVIVDPRSTEIVAVLDAQTVLLGPSGFARRGWDVPASSI